MTVRPDATVRPRPFPAGGGLCVKGWTSGSLLDSPHRLTTPLIRDGRDGPLRPAQWDEALSLIAARLAALRAEHGPDAVAVFGGGGLTNEKAYQLGKFARVALRTSRIDYNGRFCMSSAAAAGNRAFGIDRGLPFPVADIADAGAVLLVGCNVAETMPPITRHLNAQRAKGGTLIVVDPRRTATARLADLHLRPHPGTDLALACGLAHLVIADGHHDLDYIERRTTGFDALRRVLAHYWPERVERVTGVPVAAQRAAAAALAGARTALVMTGRGTEQHSNGTDTVQAWINLALALGLPGAPGSGYGCVTGQGNGQGGREHGQKADQLPGYRSIRDDADRAHVAAVWGVRPDDLPGPGQSAYELLDGLGTADGSRALLVFGSNPVVSAPNAGHIERALRGLDLLVVADFVLSETAAIADVVLPVCQWAEESGTITNLEGRVIRRRRARPAPPGVRDELDVVADLARRLGAPGFDADPETVFAELGAASSGGRADYAGITYDRLDQGDGVFWPCPSADHPGTPRLFAERFATLDGRAVFHPVEYAPVTERPDAEFPLRLTTGRVLAHYQSGAQTRRIDELAAAEGAVFVQLNPANAAELGVRDGDMVRVRTRRGAAIAAARVTDDVPVDTVFMPFHWAGDGRANLLTDPKLDPVSGMPAFKVCAARVDRAGERAS
ncbi:molybdopterin oxidoreductase family protein [Actinokineospora xionganensis]|uniref:Molybdopterin oxidoreductase family protein n=1 Tax=Actinokineospora xionganensis TaxID=2684470 RepID=A0ABR7L7Y3_9PSEU|nr:molybdopterin oxidoreductase family protein [Actinokineospora xionganensis]MBC6448653.1 molybdopterin oxidoreductase family protein [Actinokineospora xionganensis]